MFAMFTIARIKKGEFLQMSAISGERRVGFWTILDFPLIEFLLCFELATYIPYDPLPCLQSHRAIALRLLPSLFSLTSLTFSAFCRM